MRPKMIRSCSCCSYSYGTGRYVEDKSLPVGLSTVPRTCLVEVDTFESMLSGDLPQVLSAGPRHGGAPVAHG